MTLKEKVIYVEFFILGKFVFSCQKSWFLNQYDIESKKIDLAIQHKVAPTSIDVVERSVLIPVFLPKDYMKNLVGDLGINFESED